MHDVVFGFSGSANSLHVPWDILVLCFGLTVLSHHVFMLLVLQFSQRAP